MNVCVHQWGPLVYLRVVYTPYAPRKREPQGPLGCRFVSPTGTAWGRGVFPGPQSPHGSPLLDLRVDGSTGGAAVGLGLCACKLRVADLAFHTRRASEEFETVNL